MTYTEDALRRAATDRVQKRREFATHVVAYVVVNAAFVAIWALTGGGYFWPAWLLGLWAVGLVMNAWDVFWRRPITKGEIEREMERLERE
jgi:2TM domain